MSVEDGRQWDVSLQCVISECLSSGIGAEAITAKGKYVQAIVERFLPAFVVHLTIPFSSVRQSEFLPL